MKRDLENKVAWITGAGSGIGQNAAIRLSQLGMKVVLSGRSLKNLEETSSKCENENFIKLCDVSNKLRVKKVAQEIEKDFKKIVVKNFI